MGCLDAKSSGVSGGIPVSSVLFAENVTASSKKAVTEPFSVESSGFSGQIFATSVPLSDTLVVSCEKNDSSIGVFSESLTKLFSVESSGVSSRISATSVRFTEPVVATCRKTIIEPFTAKCTWIDNDGYDTYFGVSVNSHKVSEGVSVTCGLVCSTGNGLSYEWFLVEGDFFVFSDGFKFMVKKDGVSE